MAASSPGRGEDFAPQACEEAADITYLTVGFWRRSARPAPLSFLVLHNSETFVLLSEEPWTGQQVSCLLAIFSLGELWWVAALPNV